MYCAKAVAGSREKPPAPLPLIDSSQGRGRRFRLTGVRLCATLMVCAALHGAGFNGEAALKQTAKVVSFGPRPSGSAAHLKLQQYINQQLQSFGCKISEDSFPAPTPLGDRRMNNIIATVAGSSGKAVAVSGHYDTKMLPG